MVKTYFLLENENSDPFHKIIKAQEDIISVLTENSSRHVQPSYLTVTLQFNVSDIVTALLFNWLILEMTVYNNVHNL